MEIGSWSRPEARKRAGGRRRQDVATARRVDRLTSPVFIAAGVNRTCAQESGATAATVKCWGDGGTWGLGDGTTKSSSVPVPVVGITTAYDVAVGRAHMCSRLIDSTIKCWGDGALGNGSSGGSSTPVSVSGITNASWVTSGLEGSCAALNDGSVKCWGTNKFNQLGQGSTLYEPLPKTIQRQTLNQVVDVVASRDLSCSLLNTGAIKCSGRGQQGQLGNGTFTESSTPVSVSGITTAAAIASNGVHICALLTNGTIKCWGDNSYGQLGNGSKTGSSLPVTVSGITTASRIGVGPTSSCAVLTNSTVKCWGDNSYGQLGNGSTTSSTTPVTVSGITTATSVVGYNSGACARLSDATVKCWGDNSYGQLGVGSVGGISTVPVLVSGLSGVSALGNGSEHNCAVVNGGAVKCWGKNTYGQLGNGSYGSPSSVPVSVSGITTASAIAANGYEHSCARLTDNSIKCWGNNAWGQLGDGTFTNSATPVSALGMGGASTSTTSSDSYPSGAHTITVSPSGHTCSRQNDSTVKCWGNNTGGALGNGHQTNFTTPISPACSVYGVERSDYFIGITTANMPNTALNGMAASLDIHRVKPRFFPETCPATQGIVLVHGRTVEATTVFDLQYQDYSFQENLANAGIDTFSMNHLGWGRSSGLGVMNDACNGTLPIPDAGQTCPGPANALYDCYPDASLDPKNQQNSTTYLKPNPLAAACAHSSRSAFAKTTTMVQEVDAVVNDAISKTGLTKVNLLGYSAGGLDVGNYLGEANNMIRAARTAKIERAIFVASIFESPILPETEPTTDLPTYSVGLQNKANATAGFNLGAPACPGQRDDGIPSAMWASTKARDAVASSWGPTDAGPDGSVADLGLVRFPIVTRWGWGDTSAARISVPVLVMNGLKDNIVTVGTSPLIYSSLTGATSKTLVQVGCASHALFWEGCSGPTCNGWRGPHQTLAKNVKDWVLHGMIYASPGSTNGTFASTANDGTNYHTDPPITSGPPVDETIIF